MSLGDARVIGWSGGSEKYFVDLIPPIFHYEDFSADPFSLDASDFANIYGVPKSYLDKSGFDPSTGSVRMSNTVTALESQSYIRKSIVKETVFNQYTGGITRVYKTTDVSTGENALVTDDSIDFYYRKFLDSRDNLKIYTFYRTLYTYSEVEEEIIIDGGADELFSWTYYLTATRLVRKVLNRQVKCYWEDLEYLLENTFNPLNQTAKTVTMSFVGRDGALQTVEHKNMFIKAVTSSPVGSSPMAIISVEYYCYLDTFFSGTTTGAPLLTFVGDGNTGTIQYNGVDVESITVNKLTTPTFTTALLGNEKQGVAKPIYVNRSLFGRYNTYADYVNKTPYIQEITYQSAAGDTTAYTWEPVNCYTASFGMDNTYNGTVLPNATDTDGDYTYASSYPVIYTRFQSKVQKALTYSGVPFSRVTIGGDATVDQKTFSVFVASQRVAEYEADNEGRIIVDDEYITNKDVIFAGLESQMNKDTAGYGISYSMVFDGRNQAEVYGEYLLNFGTPPEPPTTLDVGGTIYNRPTNYKQSWLNDLSPVPMIHTITYKLDITVTGLWSEEITDADADITPTAELVGSDLYLKAGSTVLAHWTV